MTDDQLHRELVRMACDLASKEHEVRRLRAERDEARRELCSMNETGLRMNESDKKREAKRRGWDCWEEAKP